MLNAEMNRSLGLPVIFLSSKIAIVACLIIVGTNSGEFGALPSTL
jgi:hypothetical protein